jgi:hypothetical protein
VQLRWQSRCWRHGEIDNETYVVNVVDGKLMPTWKDQPPAGFELFRAIAEVTASEARYC